MTALFYIKQYILALMLLLLCGFGKLNKIQDEKVRNATTSTENDLIIKVGILFNGTLEELRAIPRYYIMKSLWAIQKLNLPLERQAAIWEVIKNKKPPKKLKKSILEASGNILLAAPESDLASFNMSDWCIVEYLGEVKGLSRRQVGVLASALRRAIIDKNPLHEPYIINRMKGLICGFSASELARIDVLHFIRISNQVFANVRACSSKQKQNLLNIAMSSMALGPPQVWNAKHVETLGLLISAMSYDTFSKIRPEAIEGIIPETIEAMTPTQLEMINRYQMEYLTDRSLAIYRHKMGIPSKYEPTVATIALSMLLAIVAICL